jgi:hypothetical protein
VIVKSPVGFIVAGGAPSPQNFLKTKRGRGRDEDYSPPPRSSRVEARPGLRMMPSFPRPSLSIVSSTGAPAGLSTVPRFPAPPRRTQHADFPHCGPHLLQGLWDDLSYWDCFRSVTPHTIAVEQPESVAQPRSTPPLPAEALSFPGVRQIAPDPLLNPIFDVADALTGVSNREVVPHPRSIGSIRLIGSQSVATGIGGTPP